MNITFIDNEVFAETIAEAEILEILEGPGAGQTYVAVRDGTDILIITDAMTGGAVVIHPCSEDRDSGGSVHNHARSLCV
ncbi:hypothetical protein [Pseudoduganella danionis]|uniref:hypothetical protein n=1 Tax=Pseudoduganella danionis TaxID=1890295 RepID=UPI0035B117BD